MLARVGRPKEHDDATRRDLLDAAEALIVDSGITALSVRAVADSAATTTRAVYSVFGSKEGLLQALACRTYELLCEGIEQLPMTRDPAGDIVHAAIRVFRRMAVEHQALYQLAYQRIAPDLRVGPSAVAIANRAFDLLVRRFERLAAQGLLVGRDPAASALQFHALCEGLAAVELRGMRRLGDDPEIAWREAISSFVAGLRYPPPVRPVAAVQPIE
jgi:AcrR family transcriptional regulator